MTIIDFFTIEFAFLIRWYSLLPSQLTRILIYFMDLLQTIKGFLVEHLMITFWIVVAPKSVTFLVSVNGRPYNLQSNIYSRTGTEGCGLMSSSFGYQLMRSWKITLEDIFSLNDRDPEMPRVISTKKTMATSRSELPSILGQS